MPIILTSCRYADWLLSLGDEVDGLVNIYDPLMQATAQQRIQAPDFFPVMEFIRTASAIGLSLKR